MEEQKWKLNGLMTEGEEVITIINVHRVLF